MLYQSSIIWESQDVPEPETMPFATLKPPKTYPEESDAEAGTLEMATLIDLENKKFEEKNLERGLHPSFHFGILMGPLLRVGQSSRCSQCPMRGRRLF